jgi:hypothetical protein
VWHNGQHSPWAVTAAVLVVCPVKVRRGRRPGPASHRNCHGHLGRCGRPRLALAGVRTPVQVEILVCVQTAFLPLPLGASQCEPESDLRRCRRWLPPFGGSMLPPSAAAVAAPRCPLSAGGRARCSHNGRQQRGCSPACGRARSYPLRSAIHAVRDAGSRTADHARAVARLAGDRRLRLGEPVLHHRGPVIGTVQQCPEHGLV